MRAGRRKRGVTRREPLAQGFEETLWIDADIFFQPDHVERLRSHDLPIAYAIYSKKAQRELACHVIPGTEQIIFGSGGGLTEVLYSVSRNKPAVS